VNADGAHLSLNGVQVPLRYADKLNWLCPIESPPRNGGPDEPEPSSQLSPSDDGSANVAVRTNTERAILMHNRLGHVGFNKLRQVVDFPVPSKMPCCDSCATIKSRRASVQDQAAPRKLAPGDLIHSDINGPFEPSLKGMLYAVSFIDDATRYAIVKPLARKSDLLSVFMVFIGEAKQMRLDIKPGSILQSDNGGEYRSNDMKAFLRETGIRPQRSAPHTPAHNGVAERYWLTLYSMVGTMLKQAGLPKSFWALATRLAVFILNRLPTTALSSKKSPLQALLGKDPSSDLARVRTFG
jgi:transposase InsO family protein